MCVRVLVCPQYYGSDLRTHVMHMCVMLGGLGVN